MLTEDYNGTCPKCNFKRMSVRYGSDGYYQFDACSKCGFAYASNCQDIEEKDEKVWGTILEAEGHILKEKGLPVTREGYHKWIMSLPKPTENFGSVFVHKDVKMKVKKEGYGTQGRADAV